MGVGRARGHGRAAGGRAREDGRRILSDGRDKRPQGSCGRSGRVFARARAGEARWVWGSEGRAAEVQPEGGECGAGRKPQDEILELAASAWPLSRGLSSSGSAMEA